MKRNKKSNIKNTNQTLKLFLGFRLVSKKTKECLNICLKSCHKSKSNFFFQVINFCLILMIFWFILPSKIGLLIDSSKLTGGILGNFILWLISLLFFPINKIFETSVKMTFFILLIVISFISLCYTKLFLKLVASLKLYAKKILIKIKYEFC